MATLFARSRSDRRSRVRFPDGFVFVFLSRILRIILRRRKSLNFILNIINLKCVLAYVICTQGEGTTFRIGIACFFSAELQFCCFAMRRRFLKTQNVLVGKLVYILENNLQRTSKRALQCTSIEALTLRSSLS